MSKELPTFQELLERDKDLIEKSAKSRKTKELEPEWVMLAEFGLFFGWQAVMDVRNDSISFGEMNKLLTAARRIKAIERYNTVFDTYSATNAIHDKGKSFKQTLKGIKETFNE